MDCILGMCLQAFLNFPNITAWRMLCIHSCDYLHCMSYLVNGSSDDYGFYCCI